MELKGDGLRAQTRTTSMVRIHSMELKEVNQLIMPEFKLPAGIHSMELKVSSWNAEVFGKHVRNPFNGIERASELYSVKCPRCGIHSMELKGACTCQATGTGSSLDENPFNGIESVSRV